MTYVFCFIINVCVTLNNPNQEQIDEYLFNPYLSSITVNGGDYVTSVAVDNFGASCKVEPFITEPQGPGHDSDPNRSAPPGTYYRTPAVPMPKRP